MHPLGNLKNATAVNGSRYRGYRSVKTQLITETSIQLTAIVYTTDNGDYHRIDLLCRYTVFPKDTEEKSTSVRMMVASIEKIKWAVYEEETIQELLIFFEIRLES